MSTCTRVNSRVVALSGGIGGAKLALGLACNLADGELVVVANTGDDFVHLGLHISPDIDTVTYVLAGLDDVERGWGRRDESWAFMQTLAALGGETWFRLGDRDLALHAERTRRLAEGETLSTITATVAKRLGVRQRIVPASDDPIRTVIETDRRKLDFQHYFVREQCHPRVTRIHYEGADRARPSPALLDALGDSSLEAVVICPSNPFLSIDPILAMTDLRRALIECDAPVIAISPIVGTDSIKGPTAKIMRELGLEVSAMSIARHYRDIAEAIVVDVRDKDQCPAIEALGVRAIASQTVMNSLDDKIELGRTVIEICRELRPEYAAAAEV